MKGGSDEYFPATKSQGSVDYGVIDFPLNLDTSFEMREITFKTDKLTI